MPSDYAQIFNRNEPLERGSIYEPRSNAIYYELDYELKQPATEEREVYL